MQGNWRFHIDRCRKCTWGAKEFACDGFDDHGRHDWACPPPHKSLLLPREIRKEKKAQKPPHEGNPQPRFIHETTGHRRCWHCAHAAMIIAVTEKRIKKALENKYPSQNIEIRSQKKRLKLLSENIREVNPEFLKAGGSVAPKNAHRSEAARQNLAISNIVNGSKRLRCVRMGTCLVCGKLTFDTKRPPKFHRYCWRVWLKSPDGRSFQRSLGMRRMRPGLLPRRMGAPVNENKLRGRYAWAIQCRLGGKSYRQIAKENNITDFTIVRDGIEFIMNKLPAPEFVAARFRKAIQGLRATLTADLFPSVLDG
jgi:hypothetical protein